MSNKIADKLTNFSAYRDGDDFLGTVDIELPSLEAMTETLKGAGIAGEIESPVVGHYASMTTVLNWRTLAASVMYLSKQKTHALDFRGSQQVYNAGTGEYEHEGIKVSLRAVPKTTETGKFEVGANTDSSNEMEVMYIKIERNGRLEVEIDKLNFIAFIDGEDALAPVRKNLGL